MSEVVFHRLDRDLIVRRLRDYATQELAARPEVREVVLIGSLARGDWSARSDADIVVLVDRDEDPGPFRGSKYFPTRSVGVPVDALVDTIRLACGGTRSLLARARQTDKGIKGSCGT